MQLFKRLVKWFKIKIQQASNYFRTIERKHLAFNGKHVLIVICSLFVFFWLKKPIQEFFNDLLTKTFRQVDFSPLGGWLGCFYFLLLIFIFLRLLVFRPLRYKPTIFVIALLIIISIIYFFERFCSDDYEYQMIFNSNSFLNKISLADPIMAVAFLFGFFYLFVEFFPSKPTHEQAFINSDQPLANVNEDEFERRQFVKNISSWLNNLRLSTDKSFVIGINGAWGFGKSTLLQMISKEMDKSIIKVEFNPWIASKDHNLIKDFFNTLNEEISKYISTSNLFQKYGRKITKVDDEKNPFKAFSDIFEDEPLQKSFNKLTSVLKKLNRPVFVFIDDVDRLNKDEVYRFYVL